MARRLSDPEWVAFQNDIDVEHLGLPPWGGVVEWQGLLVLVYICADTRSWMCQTLGFGCPELNPRTLCQPGEVMLTDVSDHREFLTNIPRTYDVNSGNWVYYLPQEIMAQFLRVSSATLETTKKIITTIAETTGRTAAALTAPLVEQLTPILIALAVGFLVFYMPRK